jgi:hypothetical protein
LALVNHVNKIFSEKGDVLVGRLVPPPPPAEKLPIFVAGSKEVCLW